MASNLLWAHLLRKDATAADSPSQILPIAPQDKTGTSMRMLIHDTQANLEKFSARLDGLLQRVDDCRAHVVNANKLLDVERDKVLSEVLEIAHRCQSEMKTHVGAPAQAPALDLVHVSQVSTERSVQALEKRIDALQTLLQTQAHTMQSIQDQQNTLIGAVLPLVPVLNGVSPQIDQIKAALSDVVANAVSMITNSVENARSTLVSESARGHGHVGPSTRPTSSSKPMSGSRRKRSDDSGQDINVPPSSPLDNRGRGGYRLSLKRTRIEGRTYHAGSDRLPRKSPHLAIHSTNPLPLLQTPRTPRQPFADLLFLPESKTLRPQDRVTNHMDSTSHGYIHTDSVPLAALSGPSTDVRSMSRPPFQALELPHPDLRDPSITQRCSPRIRDVPLVFDNSAAGIASVNEPSDRGALSRTIKIEEILEANTTDVISIRSSPLSSPPASLPPAGCHDLDETSGQLYTQQRSRPQDGISSSEPLQISRASCDPSPPKSMSLRDRRAQISKSGRTETRRFIPLVPWSDEEE